MYFVDLCSKKNKIFWCVQKFSFSKLFSQKSRLKICQTSSERSVGAKEWEHTKTQKFVDFSENVPIVDLILNEALNNFLASCFVKMQHVSKFCPLKLYRTVKITPDSVLTLRVIFPKVKKSYGAEGFVPTFFQTDGLVVPL